MLGFIQQILSIVAQILGIVQIIREATADNAKELVPYQIAGDTATTAAAVENATSGLVAIHADVANVHSDLADVAANVTTLLGEMTLLSAQVGTPVQTTAPPSWYASGPSASAIADEVWGYLTSRLSLGNESYQVTTLGAMEDIWSHAAYLTGWQGVVIPYNPYFAMVWFEPYRLTDVFPWSTGHSDWHDIPIPNWSLWVEGDTVLSFLQRALPAYTWTDVGPNGLTTQDIAWTWGVVGGNRQFWLRSNFTRLDVALQNVSSSVVTNISESITIPPTPVPPVWPGLDGATVGDAVALSDGMNISGPLDGLLITITTVPARAGRFAFGDLSSWRYCGAVVFRSDRSDWEWNQPIGLDTQVVTPKGMVHAAAARIRLEGGFGGTVRPFTVDT